LNKNRDLGHLLRLHSPTLEEHIEKISKNELKSFFDYGYIPEARI
jgi:hypothetical protein